MILSQFSRYTADYFVLSFYSQYRYGEWSILVLYLFTWLFGKMDITYHCTLNYNDILIFVMFYIKLSWNFVFSQIPNLCFLFILCHNFLRQSKNTINFVFLFLINRTTLRLIFVDHQVRKNTCQCISTIKVKLHSSIILSNIYQFFITLSTSQHKDKRPISKVICLLVIFRLSLIRVCTRYPSCFYFDQQNHSSFAICWPSGKKKHMSMYINNKISTTLIIDYPKKVPICHNIFNKSAQG